MLASLYSAHATCFRAVFFFFVVFHVKFSGHFWRRLYIVVAFISFFSDRCINIIIIIMSSSYHHQISIKISIKSASNHHHIIIVSSNQHQIILSPHHPSGKPCGRPSYDLIVHTWYIFCARVIPLRRCFCSSPFPARYSVCLRPLSRPASSCTVKSRVCNARGIRSGGLRPIRPSCTVCRSWHGRSPHRYTRGFSHARTFHARTAYPRGWRYRYLPCVGEGQSEVDRWSSFVPSLRRKGAFLLGRVVWCG